MQEPNASLFMLALVLRAYGLEHEADATMEIAYRHVAQDFDVPGGQVVGLLNGLGLRCTLYVTARGPIPDMLHDAAETDHLVLVGLQPSEFTPYPHWGVLEKRTDDSVPIIILGDDPAPVRSHLRISACVTGEYIVCQDRCPRLGELTGSRVTDR